MKTITVFLIALTLSLSSCTTTNPSMEEAVIESSNPQATAETILEDMQDNIQMDSQKDIPTIPQPDVPETSQQETPDESVDMSVEESTEEVSTPKDLIEPGTSGQAGGVIFNCNGTNLEEFVIDTDGMGYTEALTISQNCTMITNNEAYSGWRLPSIEELLAMYSQLFETGLVEFEETYYWAASTEDSDTAPVVYFGTGFETEFYKDMDFVGLIVVRDI